MKISRIHYNTEKLIDSQFLRSTSQEVRGSGDLSYTNKGDSVSKVGRIVGNNRDTVLGWGTNVKTSLMSRAELLRLEQLASSLQKVSALTGPSLGSVNVQVSPKMGSIQTIVSGCNLIERSSESRGSCTATLPRGFVSDENRGNDQVIIPSTPRASPEGPGLGTQDLALLRGIGSSSDTNKVALGRPDTSSDSLGGRVISAISNALQGTKYLNSGSLSPTSHSGEGINNSGLHYQEIPRESLMFEPTLLARAIATEIHLGQSSLSAIESILQSYLGQGSNETPNKLIGITIWVKGISGKMSMSKKYLKVYGIGSKGSSANSIVKYGIAKSVDSSICVKVCLTFSQGG